LFKDLVPEDSLADGRSYDDRAPITTAIRR